MSHTSDIFVHLSNRFKIDTAKIPDSQIRSAIVRLLRELDQFYISKILSKNIANFVSNVDTSNPTIADILDGELVSTDPSSLNTVLQIYINLMDQVKKNQYLQDNLIKSLKAHPKWKEFKNINIEDKCRLLANKTIRTDVRRKDKDADISLDSFYKKSSIYLEDAKKPEKYYHFTKTDTPINPDHIKKMDLFNNKNLPNLKMIMQQEIDLEKKNDKDKSNYDFKKIGINNAIAILAQANEYEFNELKGFFKKGKSGFYVTLINAHKYYEHITDQCRTTIDLCETWADNKQRAIFDHFKLLVIGQANSLKYNFITSHTGLLLGQKDHNLYFINYTV